MPNRTARANATPLPIPRLTADPALRRAFQIANWRLDPDATPVAVTRPKTKPPAGAAAISPALRRKIELAVERLISALDAIDAPAEDLEDGNDAEAEPNEPNLGASEDIDQRLGWSRPSPWLVDGEATGTLDDLDMPYAPDEAREATKAAVRRTREQLRQLTRPSPANRENCYVL